jgi:hypothetical protein
MPVQSNKAYQENVEDNAKEPNYLLIHLGEHWIIVGKTRSGKTYFTIMGLFEYMKRQFPKVPRYIIDSTNDPKIPIMIPDAIFIEGNKAPDLLKDARRTLVWTPDNNLIPQQYADFFNKVSDNHDKAIVGVDEIASMTKQAEIALERLFRQLAKHGGTVAALTQQITDVSSTFFSQATHFVQFRMNASDYDDRRNRAYLDISKDQQHAPISPYGFFHRNTSKETPMKEYSDYTEMFQGVKN